MMRNYYLVNQMELNQPELGNLGFYSNYSGYMLHRANLFFFKYQPSCNEARNYASIPTLIS